MELQVFIFFIHSIFRKFIIEEFERADTNIQNINMSLETLSQEYTYFVLEPEFCILLLEDLGLNKMEAETFYLAYEPRQGEKDQLEEEIRAGAKQLQEQRREENDDDK